MIKGYKMKLAFEYTGRTYTKVGSGVNGPDGKEIMAKVEFDPSKWSAEFLSMVIGQYGVPRVAGVKLNNVPTNGGAKLAAVRKIFEEADKGLMPKEFTAGAEPTNKVSTLSPLDRHILKNVTTWRDGELRAWIAKHNPKGAGKDGKLVQADYLVIWAGMSGAPDFLNKKQDDWNFATMLEHGKAMPKIVRRAEQDLEREQEDEQERAEKMAGVAVPD
jgi:hypothetical protein